ncbi:MAG: calcium:proton antiporter [Rhodobacterales bacterium]|nr:calcium:proton antiporter [Rhodobacterales bacterium]
MVETEADTPKWSLAAPLLTLGFVAAGHFLWHGLPSGWGLALSVPLLFATVFAAVHHAETIAHRLGDPYGSIVLAIAVTVIEVALIINLLLAVPDDASTVARDTVFAAIMIVLNGIVGLCLLLGGARYHAQGLQARGASAALGVLSTVAVLCLVLPGFTTTEPGPVFAPVQLLFVAVASLALYGMFLFVQMVRHPEDFRDPDSLGAAAVVLPPTSRALWLAIATLPLALLAVVLLAETLAPEVEAAVAAAGLPSALVGVAIAAVVLMPEALAAARAARLNRIQTSLNLALGSALASICLTIPTIALLSLVLDQPLVLGLEAEHIVLLILSLFISTLTVVMGRTTVMQGGIHLVIFSAFLVIMAVP